MIMMMMMSVISGRFGYKEDLPDIVVAVP